MPSVDALTGATRRDFDRPFVTMYYRLPRDREMELEANRELQDEYTEAVAEELYGRYGGRKKRVKVSGVRVTAGAGWLFPVHAELKSRSGKTTIYIGAVEELHDEVTSAVREYIGEEVAPYSDDQYDEIEIKA